MSKDKTQAFPRTEYTSPLGMDLRDWFAGMALQGFVNQDLYSYSEKKDYCKMSYEVADSMMEARKK